MATTMTLRNWWAPACAGPFSVVELHGEGRVTVRSAVVPAVHALNAALIDHDYRTRRADTGGYNCRKITGGTGYSLHAYGIAVDLNWQSNPYGRTLITDMPRRMVADIKAIRTRNDQQVWRWGGDYSGNKDAMHFEVVCRPGDLSLGLEPSTIPTDKPAAPTEDDDTMHGTEIIASYGEAGYNLADRKVWRDIRAWTHAIYAKPEHERAGGVAYVRHLLGLDA